MYLSFQLGPSRNFIIESERVEQVLQEQEIFAVPACRDEVLGVIEFKGLLVPVFEFRLLFPDLFSELIPLPHLILFRSSESLNAFPAEALETVTDDLPSQESLYQHPCLNPLEYRVEGHWHRAFLLEAIEPHLNIP